MKLLAALLLPLALALLASATPPPPPPVMLTPTAVAVTKTPEPWVEITKPAPEIKRYRYWLPMVYSAAGDK